MTPVDIKRWHGQLLESGRADGGALSVSSVRLAHRILHRALNDAVRWNLIMVNPATAARAPRAEHKEMNVWTADDARRFLDAVADHRLVGLWTLALHTGLRRGELAGLRWSDLDLDAGTLTVAQQRTSANYETVVTKPKAKSQRQLLLAPATVAALRGHRQRQVEERLAVGPGWKNSGYVFVDELGVEYHPQRFTKMFEDIVAATGAPKIRLHDTRHTMATLALEAGVHPKVVQEQLGHSAIAVTMDTYSHVPQAVKRNSAEKDRRTLRRYLVMTTPDLTGDGYAEALREATAAIVNAQASAVLAVNRYTDRAVLATRFASFSTDRPDSGGVRGSSIAWRTTSARRFPA